MSKTVLIIDDTLFIRDVLRSILEENSYQVLGEAASGMEAIKKAQALQADIITLDILLPDANGLDLVPTILAASPRSKIVICSAIGQTPVIQKTMSLGARAFIQKPFTPDQVVHTLSGLED